MAQLKVLISAYSCRPGMGSEPGVGWNIAKEVAKHHKVWVLTRSDNRPMIEAELEKNPIPDVQFVYFDLPGVSWWKRGLQGVHLHYYLWQVKAYFVARILHSEVNLDIIHHITYVRYSSPSFLALLPVPFIWGPVGGGESAPKAFWQDFNQRSKMYERLRGWARSLGEQDLFVRITARRSCLTYATTKDTALRLAKIGSRNVQVLSQVGLSSDEARQIVQHSLVEHNCVRFISVGRLLHWKGFHLGLRAFAQASLPSNAEYFIVGKGGEEAELRSLATDLGIASQVKFLNEVPRTELLYQMGTCLALVHPSLHESGGFVCLEAMAVGCPVICLDLGGPAVQVTPETGFKVFARTPEQAITEIANCMACLAKEPELRAKMGEAGQRHVKEFYSWEAKALLFSRVYEQSIAR
ncbi:glycosyltransferase family 4 protein [Cyanobacteria bacterium FACHB-63]|nr:glycosyltransferase family 4 protein [Cyanobacteria bacterium FACHB-63]